MASIARDRAKQYSKQNCQEKQRQFPRRPTRSQAHRLTRVGSRRTQGSHHLNSTVHTFFFFKLRPMPRLVLRTLKAVTKASINPEAKMQRVSLRTAVFNSKSLRIAVREIHSLVVPSHLQRLLQLHSSWPSSFPPPAQSPNSLDRYPSQRSGASTHVTL